MQELGQACRKLRFPMAVGTVVEYKNLGLGIHTFLRNGDHELKGVGLGKVRFRVRCFVVT